MQRQAAIDYLKREIEFAAAVGATYLLVVPGAVGRPQPYDDMEFHRSAETLRIVGDLFVKYNIKAAIKPIRSAEVSIVHTFADAKDYIRTVNHPGVSYINGDVYHMQTEETSIAGAIIKAGNMLTNLHLADSNRQALGDGFMDLDVILMALYLINFNSQRQICNARTAWSWCQSISGDVRQARWTKVRSNGDANCKLFSTARRSRIGDDKLTHE